MVAAEGAVVAAMIEAVKASGAIVRMETKDFLKILSKTKQPLVVRAKGGFMWKKFQYLTGYKGLVFFTQSKEQIMLPSDAEIVAAKTIWIPT